MLPQEQAPSPMYPTRSAFNLGCKVFRCSIKSGDTELTTQWSIDHRSAVHALSAGTPRKKRSCKTAPFDQVVFMNFSRHLGQVMEILPLPLGTLTC